MSLRPFVSALIIASAREGKAGEYMQPKGEPKLVVNLVFAN